MPRKGVAMINELEARLKDAEAGKPGAAEALGALRFPYVIGGEKVSARLTNKQHAIHDTPARARAIFSWYAHLSLLAVL